MARMPGRLISGVIGRVIGPAYRRQDADVVTIVNVRYE
jgi:hypothetical protein